MVSAYLGKRTVSRKLVQRENGLRGKEDDVEFSRHITVTLRDFIPVEWEPLQGCKEKNNVI